MLPRGSPPCVTSYSHSPRSAATAADHGYMGFPNQQNQFGHVSLNNFFSADSLLTPASNPAFDTKPEFERRSSSIAVLRMKAKEHTANISWAMWSGFPESPDTVWEFIIFFNYHFLHKKVNCSEKKALCHSQWSSNKPFFARWTRVHSPTTYGSVLIQKIIHSSSDHKIELGMKVYDNQLCFWLKPVWTNWKLSSNGTNTFISR